MNNETTSVRVGTKSVNKLKTFLKKNKQYTIGGYITQALDEKLGADKAFDKLLRNNESNAMKNYHDT